MNSFGQLFRLMTCGESHGPMLVGIVDGCPAGLPLSENDLQPALDRRKPGTSRYTSQRREPDQVRIISGVHEGKTTGAPIGLLIENTAQRSKDYAEIENKFRPGHADFTYFHKYGLRDPRGGGRASARDTALWVAAGAIAQHYLTATAEIRVQGYLSALGDIALKPQSLETVYDNPFFCAEPDKLNLLGETIEKLRKAGDSIGAGVKVFAENVPVGLGEPVFGKLDAHIAQAMMSINAAKGVEIGAGFESIRQRGSQHRDEMTGEGFLSNEAGGVLGGISTGQNLLVHVAFKPTSSILIPGKTVTTTGEETTIITKGRHDPCVGIRAVPICEAMLAMVIMDAFLQHRARQ